MEKENTIVEVSKPVKRRKKKGKRKRKLDAHVDVHQDRVDFQLEAGKSKANVQINSDIGLIFHLINTWSR